MFLVHDLMSIECQSTAILQTIHTDKILMAPIQAEPVWSFSLFIVTKTTSAKRGFSCTFGGA